MDKQIIVSPVKFTLIFTVIFLLVGLLVYFSVNKWKSNNEESLGQRQSKSNTINTPTLTPSPVNNGYKIKVDNKNQFVLSLNGQVINQFNFKQKTLNQNLMVYRENVINNNNLIYFFVSAIPGACDITETAQDIENCRVYLSTIASDFDAYGGIWSVDLTNYSYKHLFNIPKQKTFLERVDQFTLDNSGTLTLVLKYNSYQNQQENIVYKINSESGELTQ